VTASGPARHLTAAPEGMVAPRVHADRATYEEWVEHHCTSYASRWDRIKNYDRFVERWPSLQDWFDAPLRQRLLDKENCVRGQHPHGGASVIMPYLTYLSLVHGVGLDYPVLLARTFTSPFKLQARHGGLGVDAGLFDRHMARLTELGYATARTQLVWPLGRMLLHRGDPDLTALGVDDLDELRAAIDAFTARLRLDPVREFYSRAPAERPPAETADGYLRSAIARVHAVHVLLFDLGQVDRPPTGRVTAGSWMNQLAPPEAPPKIRAVIERYLRLHLHANLDPPQTVRHARDALRRLVTWMVQAHPEITSLADLHRQHAEEFLRWLGTQTNQQTGAPLSISFRRTVVTLITRFVTETAAWGLGRRPGTGAVHPRRHPEDLQAAAPVHPRPRAHQAHGRRRSVAQPLPAGRVDRGPVERRPPRRDPPPRRRLPRHLPRRAPATADPGWQGIRRTHDPAAPTGRRRAAAAHRLGPQHRRSATLRPQRRPGGPAHLRSARQTAVQVAALRHVAEACTAAGLVDSAGKATITAHRFRHTIGTQLAEGGARIQTIMVVLGHATPNMSIIYSTLSDPTVKQQYQDALDRHLGPDVTLACPAADALREHRLDPEAVSWLQTNFLKTELELGHCLRTPAEGPCECDLVLTCSKFLTTSDYAPRLRARLEVEQQLIDDATARGWPREIERHEATKRRLQQLLHDLA
jgi:integrase